MNKFDGWEDEVRKGDSHLGAIVIDDWDLIGKA